MISDFFYNRYWLLIAGVAAATAALYVSKSQARRVLTLSALSFSILASSMFVLIVATGFDMRRVAIGIIASYIGLGILALQKAPLQEVRMASVFLVAIVQCLILMSAAFEFPIKVPDMIGRSFSRIPKPVKETISTIEIFNWLKSQLLPNRAVVLSLGHAVQVGPHETRPFDVGLFSILSEKEGIPLNFGFPPDRITLSKNEILELGYTHILIDTSTPVEPKHLNEPYEQLDLLFQTATDL